MGNVFHRRPLGANILKTYRYWRDHRYYVISVIPSNWDEARDYTRRTKLGAIMLAHKLSVWRQRVIVTKSTGALVWVSKDN